MALDTLGHQPPLGLRQIDGPARCSLIAAYQSGQRCRFDLTRGAEVAFQVVQPAVGDAEFGVRPSCRRGL